MPRKVRIIVFFLCLGCFSVVFSQEKAVNKHFFESEYLIGKIIPNDFDYFPKNGPQQIVAFNYGILKHDTSSWGRFYNFPEIGITALYGNAGNNRVFGHQISLLPFVTFNVFNQSKAVYKLRIGLGASYFSERFDIINNPTNNVISSIFSWDIRTALYRNIIETNKFVLKFGVGFAHQSNSHTKIPNKGMNSLLFSISGQFYNSEDYKKPERINNAAYASKDKFIHFRQGFGFHEQNEYEGPQTNLVRPVYSTTVGFGKIINHHVKLSTGFTYRFYQHYYDHITDSNIVGLSNHPSLNASNFLIYFNGELFMHHVGLDFDLEVNVFKPFFNHFHPSKNVVSTLRQLLSTRKGLNLYLFDTHSLPKTNIYIGAYVNTNLGRADFMEFSVGMLKKL
ncbi:MAG: hypothetical protein COW67_00495 [Flavobacteriales bacterium CG18_big_fil_WC_8_21_14_2_50_32_9]|nr:MAG: hypothetical protein COW67_00495 [Flavobacteriales bacterium CG18_big_fil_WC_8_21_14_2_50_32_9]PJC61737.1 MAG: hypothetical protein CO022_08275 [Flavobacteriales bacterium CG_4_9_14_0_2_um_filter_32_27]